MLLHWWTYGLGYYFIFTISDCFHLMECISWLTMIKLNVIAFTLCDPCKLVKSQSKEAGIRTLVALDDQGGQWFMFQCPVLYESFHDWCNCDKYITLHGLQQTSVSLMFIISLEMLFLPHYLWIQTYIQVLILYLLVLINYN